MAKTVLLNAYRRFLTTEEAILEAYQKVLEAHQSDATDGVVITNGQFEGGQASGQYVIQPKDREEIMEVLEILLQEIQAAADNTSLPVGPTHLDFSNRIVGT